MALLLDSQGIAPRCRTFPPKPQAPHALRAEVNLHLRHFAAVLAPRRPLRALRELGESASPRRMQLLDEHPLKGLPHLAAGCAAGLDHPCKVPAEGERSVVIPLCVADWGCPRGPLPAADLGLGLRPWEHHAEHVKQVVIHHTPPSRHEPAEYAVLRHGPAGPTSTLFARTSGALNALKGIKTKKQPLSCEQSRAARMVRFIMSRPLCRSSLR